jgi:hypothetical protein
MNQQAFGFFMDGINFRMRGKKIYFVTQPINSMKKRIHFGMQSICCTKGRIYLVNQRIHFMME